MSPDHGFSLVEMMIVVAILSILSIGATLSIRTRGTHGPTDAAILTQMVSDLRDEAILSRQSQSLTITGDAITHWQDDGKGGWSQMGASRQFRGIAQTEPGYGAVVTPELGLRAVFLPDGRASAFGVGLNAAPFEWQCETDGWGPMTCDMQR